ncbi:hypothetical protein HMPREF0454_01718 [Hafnia alvei ATCC 51873]|uniref:Uncharacterized protein n=1 Tax=Hafnia alvei ATCC 51873 TaxID=1002364 RepID=G9Y591_HAFAL|nr:hypothetical protein HMPREF0454_01718 [Hafnia alvei ATCC 51873]
MFPVYPFLPEAAAVLPATSSRLGIEASRIHSGKNRRDIIAMHEQ